MVGSMPPPPTNPYMTNKMAGWAAQPSPAYHRGTIDSQLRWAHHLDATGQNIYAVGSLHLSLPLVLSLLNEYPTLHCMRFIS